MVADALELPSYSSVLPRLEKAEMAALRSELYWKGKLSCVYWICCFSINQHAGICSMPTDVDPVTRIRPPACNCDHEKNWSDTEPMKDGQSVTWSRSAEAEMAI